MPHDFFASFSNGQICTAFFHYYHESLWLCEQKFFQTCLFSKKDTASKKQMAFFKETWEKQGLVDILEIAAKMPCHFDKILSLERESKKNIVYCPSCKLYLQKYNFSAFSSCPSCGGECQPFADRRQNFYPGIPFFQMRLADVEGKEADEPNFLFLILGNYVQQDYTRIACEIKHLLEKFFSCVSSIAGQWENINQGMAWFEEFSQNIHELLWLFLQKVAVSVCWKHPDFNKQSVENAIQRQKQAFSQSKFVDIFDLLRENGANPQAIFSVLAILGLHFARCCGHTYVLFPFLLPSLCPRCGKKLEASMDATCFDMDGSSLDLKRILFSPSVLSLDPTYRPFVFYKRRHDYTPAFEVSSDEFYKSYQAQFQESVAGWQLYRKIDRMLADLSCKSSILSQKSQGVQTGKNLQKISEISQNARKKNSLISYDTHYIQVLTDFGMTRNFLAMNVQDSPESASPESASQESFLDSFQNIGSDESIYESFANARERLQNLSREGQSHSREDQTHSREDQTHSREDQTHSREGQAHSPKNEPGTVSEESKEIDALLDSGNIGTNESVYESFCNDITRLQNFCRNLPFALCRDPELEDLFQLQREIADEETCEKSIDGLRNYQRKIAKNIPLPLSEIRRLDWRERSKRHVFQISTSKVRMALFVSFAVSVVILIFMLVSPIRKASPTESLKATNGIQNPSSSRLPSPEIAQNSQNQESTSVPTQNPAVPTQNPNFFVVDQETRPIANATIVLKRESEVKTAITDAQGKCNLVGMPGQEYSLTVSASAYLTSYSTILFAEGIHKVVLTRLPRIYGTISPKLAHFDYSFIQIIAKSPHKREIEVRCKRDGQWERCVPPGQYKLYLKIDGNRLESEEISLASGEEKKVELCLPPHGNLKITTDVGLTAKQLPISAALLLRNSQYRIQRQIFLNREGEVQVPCILVGNYHLLLTIPDYFKMSLDSVEITADVETSVYLNTPNGKIHGIVAYEEKDKPKIILKSLGKMFAEEPYQVVYPQGTGEFSIDYLPASDYLLMAISRDGAAWQKIGVKPQESQFVQISLQRYCSLRVKVRDGEIAIARANVKIAFQVDPNYVKSAITNAEGIAEISHLLPGHYLGEIQYEKQGLKTQKFDVTIDKLLSSMEIPLDSR